VRRAALVLCAVLGATAWAGKPVLAVLAVQSDADRGKIGRFVRKSLHEKLSRTYQYVIIAPEDADGAATQAGFRLTAETPPEKVAEFAAGPLDCRIVLWGFVTRASQGWIIRIHGMDLEENRKGLKWQMQEPVAAFREVPTACERIAEQISGFEKQVGQEPEVPEAKRRPEPRRNLLSNGDFERGEDTPAQWQRVDNLATFWDSKSKSGRGLLVDTDVLESQLLQWRKAIAGGADFRKPPKKEQTRPPKYDTIGGTYGVHFVSDPIPVKRGMVYRLSADVKGRSVDIFFPKIFVKAYAGAEATDFEAQDRELYRMYLACRSETEGREFEFHTRTFLPNAFYVVFDLEDAAGTPHAAKATDLLRRRMAERRFPLIPLEEQRRRLAGAAVRFDTVMSEVILNVRDKLLCGHGIYGKVEKTDQGPQLCLRLASARIKRNVPLVDMAYPAGDDNALAEACDKFLTECERRLPFVEYMRVIPYAYWPPGEFRFDNLVLTEEGDTLW